MLVIVFIAIALASIFFFLRNQWVYEKRIDALLRQGLYEYDRLPSYDSMLWRFWIWDAEKFKQPLNEGN